MLELRLQHEAADKFEFAEPARVRIAPVERCNWRCLNFDPLGAGSFLRL